MRQTQGNIFTLLTAQTGDTTLPEHVLANGNSSAVAALSLTDGAATMTPGAHIGHWLKDAAGTTWVITANTATRFTLEDFGDMGSEDTDVESETPAAGAYFVFDPALFLDTSRMSGATMRVTKYFVTVSVTGTGSCKLAMWARDQYGKTWAPCGENQGLLNLGVALEAGQKAHLPISNLGVFALLQLVVQESAGSPVIDAYLSEIYENNFLQGD